MNKINPEKIVLSDETNICAMCSYCNTICPTHSVIRWESCSPRGKIFAIKKQSKDYKFLSPHFIQRLYECTLCAKCEEVCQTNIPLLEYWQTLRGEVFNQDKLPHQFNSLDSALSRSRNIYDMPQEDRLNWALNIEDEVEPHLQRKAEIAYFTGCSTSYQGLNSTTGEAIHRLFRAINTEYTILGGEEWCCGHPYYVIGGIQKVKEYAQHNIDAMKALGVNTIMTNCPGCYKAWKNEYPEVLGVNHGLKILHSTQWLDDLVSTGKLSLKFPSDLKVTYHDPCELGRHCDIYDQPRRLLRRVSGLTFNEMAETRERSNCCGAGGALRFLNNDMSLEIAGKVIQEAEKTGADVLVSACPTCKITLKEGADFVHSDIQVLDILEIIDKAVNP